MLETTNSTVLDKRNKAARRVVKLAYLDTSDWQNYEEHGVLLDIEKYGATEHSEWCLIQKK